MQEINLMTTHGGKAGRCPDCGKPFTNLANHLPHCRHRDHNAAAIRQTNFIDRAVSHCTAVPRSSQAWQHAVTDRDVAVVMYAVEALAVDIQLNANHQWVGFRVGTGVRLHWVVSEMVRTGLLRHTHVPGPTSQGALVPALVHLKASDGWSACHFTGEDLGPMRARLARDLALVDCLNCLAIAEQHARGL